MESESLKARTETLCLNLEIFEKEVKAKTIGPEDAKQRWESTYKPEADSLAQEMLQYVPNDDPRITVVASSGNKRIIKPDALNCIHTVFSQQYVSGHMDMVRRQLRGLAETLPTETDA